MARPFSPSSSLPPATADALAASPLSTPPLAPTEFLRQNPPPDFPSRSNHHPPPFRFLPRSFQDFPFLQPSQSEPTFRFTLFNPFSQLLLFIPLSSFFFFFYVISLQSSTLSLFLFLLILRFIDRRISLHHEISRRLRNFIVYPRNFFLLFTFPFDPFPFPRY